MKEIKKTSLYLPADLLKRLKIYCIHEEKTMTFLRLGQTGQSSIFELDR